MNTLLSKTEVNLFCLLIIVFLYFFKKKSFSKQKKCELFMHVFLAVGCLFSIIKNIYTETVLDILCVCCYLFSAVFLSVSVFERLNEKKISFLKSKIALCLLLFLIITFYTIKYELNLSLLILSFTLISMFVIDQYNTIRIDNLTKLYNRYGMDAELKEQLRQYEHEENDSFYIISCDLDNFKQINDTWGHVEGDRALVLVAGVLSKVAQKFSSNVFRIGGDEFVIIADTSEKGIADEVSNAIKNELDNLEFRDDFDIKMSIGAALYDGTTSINELLNCADKKLYEAKKQKETTYVRPVK